MHKALHGVHAPLSLDLLLQCRGRIRRGGRDSITTRAEVRLAVR